MAAQMRAIDLTKLDDALITMAAQAATLKTIVEDVESRLRAGVEHELIQLVLRLGPSVAEAAHRAGETVLAAIEPLLALLASAYAKITEGRDDLQHLIKGTGTGKDMGLLQTWLRLVRSRLGDALFTIPCDLPASTGCTDRLTYEAGLADKAAKTGSSFQERITAARALASVWHEPGPAVVALARQFAGINAEFVRTLLLSAIDLRPLRREIESRIRDLIPSRVTLDYALNNELDSFPGNDPIFQPGPNTRLTLQARTTINLLPDAFGHLKTELAVHGEMGPFAIALLGSRFDVVTLFFDGLSFNSGSGRSPDFKVRFRDVKMGQKAKFLEQLQSYLSPKGGGFYLRFLAGGAPGIEAGYGINLGVIGVGTLSFSNVVLNAAVRLPFEQSADARFIVSIGRSDAPFLISSTIFGGGGYLALIANTQRFVGFEASFDYGGVAAFGFGPLQGIGRLTMGIYLHKEDTQTALGATFFAGGEAHIACFSLATALMVRLVQDNGGPMCGTATYVYAFSIGIKDIEFPVVVAKNEGQTMGGGTKSGALSPPRTRLAALSTGTMSDAGPAVPLPCDADGSFTGQAHVEQAMPKQDEDWRAYREYFDVSLRPAKRLRWSPM